MNGISIIIVAWFILFSSCKPKKDEQAGSTSNSNNASLNKLGIETYDNELKILFIAEHSLEINEVTNIYEGSDNDIYNTLIPSLLNVSTVEGSDSFALQANPRTRIPGSKLKRRQIRKPPSPKGYNELINLLEGSRNGTKKPQRQELDDVFREVEKGRLGVQPINSKMDLVTYDDILDDPSLISKSLGDQNEAFITYSPGKTDIPNVLRKYYEVDINPSTIPPYLNGYKWKVAKIKLKPVPQARQLTPKEIELFNKIDAGEDVRGSFSNLLWTHNMPSSTLLKILDNPIQLKNLGDRGLQFRYGLDSQYGDVNFILKNRPLSYWHSKPGKKVKPGPVVNQDKAGMVDFWNGRQIPETEIKSHLHDEANNYGFLGDGRLREDVEHYQSGNGACKSKSEGRPPWCNVQMHLNTDIGPEDISAVILPGFLRSHSNQIQERLPGVDLLFVDDVPTYAYHTYYKDPSKEILDIGINAGSKKEAIQSGVMRNPIGEGTSSNVSVSRMAFFESQKVYLKYVAKHTDQLDADKKLLSGFANTRHSPMPFNAREMANLKKYYDVPYTGRVKSPDDKFPNQKGLARANHGLAHGLRQGAIAVDMINALRRYGGQENDLANWIRNKSINDPFFDKKIEMAAVYQRTGRIDEASPSQNILAYAPQGKASVDNFRKAAKKSGLFTDEEIIMYERAIMRDEINRFHQSVELLNLRQNPSADPGRLEILEETVGKKANGKPYSGDELLAHIQGLESRGGILEGDELMIDQLIHASHMADLRRLHRSWNTPDLVPNEIAKYLNLRMDVPKEKALVDEIYSRTGRYLEVTGAPDSTKKVKGSDKYQDLNKFVRQAKNPKKMTEAINSVRTQKFSFETDF